MPANSTHPDYDANAALWSRTRDVIAGEDAVKAAGETYLPRLDSQSDEEYKAYKTRASYFNASARTADGYVGLIFRREPTLKLPDASLGVGRALHAFVEDANLLGTSLPAYAKNITRVPLRLGQPLPLIPFVFHGPRHSLPDVDKLPLADIIAVNLDHYRLNADFHHGLHFTALPTAWVSGFDKSDSLRIGSSTAWVAEAPGATAGFLEFKGQGLMTFERAMDRDQHMMAVLGSRMLEAQKRVGESSDAIELRQSGENSVLSAVSTSLSDSLTQVLRWVYWWNSTETTPLAIVDNAVLIKLNTDFTVTGMASAQITAIVSAWQAGAISRDTMFELFRKGEVLPAGRSNEEEQKLLAAVKTNLPPPNP